MRSLRQIQIEMSEHRALLNGETELPEEKQTETRKKLVELENEFQKSLKAQDEAEKRKEADRQFAELRMGIELRNYLSAAIKDGSLSGREKEYNAELKLDDRHVVPWDAFVDRDETEDRADVVADVSGSSPNKPRMPVIERVFRRSDASWLGISMPSVAAGEPSYPVMLTGATGSAKAADAAVDAEATTFEAHSVEPHRAANARYLFNMETLAKYGSQTEDLLRRDARRVMAKVFDDQIVSGSGTGANLKGFLHADFVESTGVTDPTAKAKPTDFDAAYSDRLDLLFSYSTADIKMLIGKETLQYLLKTRVDSGAAMDQGGHTYASMLPSGQYRASSRVTAAASNIQKAYTFRQNELRAIAPVWNSVSMIRDPYTKSANAQVAITFIMLFGFVMPRGTKKIQEVRFKLA